MKFDLLLEERQVGYGSRCLERGHSDHVVRAINERRFPTQSIYFTDALSSKGDAQILIPSQAVNPSHGTINIGCMYTVNPQSSQAVFHRSGAV